MKNILVKILTVAIFLSICGCAPKNEIKTGSADELLWLVPGNAQPDISRIMEKANEIIEPQTGATLNLKFIHQGDYEDEMKMYMASGKSYDLCFTSYWLNIYDSAVKNGAFYDITDLLNDNPDLKADIPEYVFKNISYDGRIYAMPNLQIMVRQLALQVRSDLVEKYNFSLDNVKTIDDIEPFLEIIKKNEPDVYPYRKAWGISPWTYNKLEEFGSTAIFYNYDTNQIKPFWENPEALSAMERLREWYRRGYIRKDVDSQGDDTSLYNDGAYAVCITTWKPSIEKFDESNLKMPYLYKRLGEARKLMLTGENAMTSVGANSKMPEKAFELLKLINTDKKLYNLICNGIKNIHYTMNSNGKIKNKPNSGYNPGTDWKFGNQFNAYIKEGMDNDVWEKTQELNNSAIASPRLGFKIDRSPIAAEMLNIIAVNEKYIGEDYTDFIVSDDYGNYINEYKEKAKDAGIDKVIAEISRQARDYIKKQEE